MGCYDTVKVPCPNCGTTNDFQSKGGDCLMRSYTLDNAPDDVLSDVNRHSPYPCSECGCELEVGTLKGVMIPITVSAPAVTAKKKKVITYVLGDLFNNLQPDDVIIHVCNDIGRIGGGFTAPLIKMFPSVRTNYVRWFNNEMPADRYSSETSPVPSLGHIQTMDAGTDDNIWVVNMIGQHGTISADNPKPIKYAALVDCLRRVRDHIPKTNRIVAPLLGAGLAGGDWSLIAQIIEEIFAYREIVVYVLAESDLPEKFRKELIHSTETSND